MTKITQFRKVFEVNSTPVYWLDTMKDVIHLRDILKKNAIKKIAIDQERKPYNKFYYQIPCLLQIASEDMIVFIDLLDNQNITDPIKDVLENPSIQKIFFDAPWDVFYFQKYLDLNINAIKDIQVASSLLYPTIGTTSLISLVKDEFKVEIKKSKKQQKSDWSKRPLKTKQIEYASHEIAWFLPVYEALLRKLQQKGLSPFFRYGNNRINLDIPNLDYSPMNIRRVKGYDTLSNKEKRKLIQLGIIRDKLAREWDRPVFHVLTNQQLLVLSKGGKTLQKVLTSRQRFSKNARNLINQALQDSYPDSPIENDILKLASLPHLKQQLLSWRYSASKIHKIPKRFIISTNEVDSFDEHVFSSETELLKSIWFN